MGLGAEEDDPPLKSWSSSAIRTAKRAAHTLIPEDNEISMTCRLAPPAGAALDEKARVK